jgi:glycosyltransferase involved in cell wall biosynthesis
MKDGKRNLKRQAKRRIGFISTRLEGTDGVSLETGKWAEALEGLGHTCYYFAGKSDRPASRSRVVPEAFFLHPEILKIDEAVFRNHSRPPRISVQVHRIKDKLKRSIKRFVSDFGIELLIAENALTIPLNLPLGLALTEFIAETNIHTIAHHHDFFWERVRFLANCGWDYLFMSFPADFPSVRHVVINSSAGRELSFRRGISSHLIPNVMDFEHPPRRPDKYVRDIRDDLGVASDEKLILQPTRVVQRKGIERSIELVDRLGLKACLVVSHAAGDEGDEYERHIRTYAKRLDVKTTFEADIIRDNRGKTKDGRKIYTLSDVYPHADLVTYPSALEGFGNAFLEAVYFRCPIVVNDYTIFAVDIKPKGFRVIEFDGYVSERTVRKAREVLENKKLAAEMAEHNYRVAKRHYSCSLLERRLRTLIGGCFGEA